MYRLAYVGPVMVLAFCSGFVLTECMQSCSHTSVYSTHLDFARLFEGIGGQCGRGSTPHPTKEPGSVVSSQSGVGAEPRPKTVLALKYGIRC